jgi:hypothetical protein
VPEADKKTNDLIKQAMEFIARNSNERISGSETGTTLARLVWYRGKLTKVLLDPEVVLGDDGRGNGGV